MDPEALPSALATVGGAVRSYDDESVVGGTTYFYRVAAVLSGSPEKLAVSDEVSILAASGGGSGSGSAGSPAEGFRGFIAKPSTTQSLTATTNATVDFGDEVLDTDGAFASGVFTVPTALEGAFMSFQARVAIGTVGDIRATIARSTDGGASWVIVAGQINEGAGVVNTVAEMETGPMQVFSGEQYGVRVYPLASATITVAETQFSGSVEG